MPESAHFCKVLGGPKAANERGVAYVGRLNSPIQTKLRQSGDLYSLTYNHDGLFLGSGRLHFNLLTSSPSSE